MTETAKKPLELWAEENFKGQQRLLYKVRRSLFSEESEFQRIDIVETTGFGRMLFNDSIAMLSERDEFVYHDMIAHVPLFVHPAATRVLVIGGGDGGTVRELLRHPSVKRCLLVEIDPRVLEGCRRHIPSTAAALDDPRVEVRVEDGVRFVASTEERFDLAIIDSTDPIGPAQPLFGPAFYADVYRVLDENGVVVSQAESPFHALEAQCSLLEILSARFARVALYNYVNMTYPGGLWSFSFAAKGQLCPVGDFDPRRVQASKLDFRYYSPEVHLAAFAHPRFQAQALERYLSRPKPRA